MMLKNDLKTREAHCSDAEGYAELALESLQDSGDIDYAKHLLEQGECQCEFAAQFIQLAEIAITAGESGYAGNLYEQALDVCFQGKDFAELAISLTTHTHEQNKAREVLEQAVIEAENLEEMNLYVSYAKSIFKDDEFASLLLTKVNNQLELLADYETLDVAEEVKPERREHLSAENK